MVSFTSTFGNCFFFFVPSLMMLFTEIHLTRALKWLTVASGCLNITIAECTPSFKILQSELKKKHQTLTSSPPTYPSTHTHTHHVYSHASEKYRNDACIYIWDLQKKKKNFVWNRRTRIMWRGRVCVCRGQDYLVTQLVSQVGRSWTFLEPMFCARQT